MNVDFKIASLNDVEEIVDLCNECFNENTSYEFAKTSFRKTLFDGNQIYINGYMDGLLVAHVKVTIIPTMYEGMETYAILNHVCVKPEYRRHNIATHMLDFVTQIAKSRNCIALELWSKNFREAAHACYKNYGFEVIDAKFFSKSI